MLNMLGELLSNIIVSALIGVYFILSLSFPFLAIYGLIQFFS